ncbi:MAG: Multimodular transpeptidase-transglycosylase (EC (EC [uncultured Sulfurovum sp.]|uniref:Multimodular transpeptidase-transglycosylase ) n=1 Tax=uncultured Sulfurovum sp. TaxID=269237 RepID=A0A6S6TDR9_9BACT|nr:MAG: Multimodular transpeptidase-transglycosylase (EC (EC [uncultured Sulfurovum sp.]
MVNQLIKGSILLAIIFAMALFAAFIYAYNEIKLDADKLINYNPPTSSVILDSKGDKIAYVFKGQHRLYATYDEIPGYVVEALVAIEDTRFFEHNGVNPDAIIRAALRNYEAGRKVEGGSTLTQQLVKNTILNNERSYSRKMKEAILSMKIENELTKEEILERYLNEMFFGHGYYGIKTAAKGYYRKELDELTLKESALLAGLMKAPSAYDPTRNLDKALTRASTILARMKKLGWINHETYLDAIKEIPTIYKDTLTQNIAPYITDEVIRRMKKEFPNVRTGGYTIHTTIDMEQQKIARESLKYAHKKIVKKQREKVATTTLNGAILAVENKTGDIKAMVGGVDYKRSAYNRATMMVRQPGSAFKPFIYQVALDMGYNPGTELTDIARTFQYYSNGKRKIWRPKNYEGTFKGFVKLREALVHSRNLATINLVTEVGLNNILERLEKLNVPKIPQDMSVSLGNLGLSPVKMGQIYSAFANGGHMIEPRLIAKVKSRNGTVIYEGKTQEINDFTTPEQAYLMTDILKDIVTRGTGKNARVKGVEVGGKTGTTNKNVDAWFCGYSPTTEVIVWIGRDNNKPIGRGGTGGGAAAPAFSYFLNKLHNELYKGMPKKFARPEGVYNARNGVITELYTDISPLPIATASVNNPYGDTDPF